MLHAAHQAPLVRVGDVLTFCGYKPVVDADVTPDTALAVLVGQYLAASHSGLQRGPGYGPTYGGRHVSHVDPVVSYGLLQTGGRKLDVFGELAVGHQCIVCLLYTSRCV